MRDVILDFLTIHTANNYVLTNNLYDVVGDKKLFAQVKEMALNRGSIFLPVRLVISEEEHLKRVTQPERRARWKSIDPDEVYDQTPLLAITDPNYLELNISQLSPEDAADTLMKHLSRLKI